MVAPLATDRLLTVPPAKTMAPPDSTVTPLAVLGLDDLGAAVRDGGVGGAGEGGQGDALAGLQSVGAVADDSGNKVALCNFVQLSQPIRPRESSHSNHGITSESR